MIKIKEISKAFGDINAVDGISLEIARGEIFGFLGPNGAGKTTLLSILSTHILQDGGSASVMGFDTQKDAKKLRKSIGIVFQEPSLDEKLTGRENMEISAVLYKVPKNKRKEKIDELLDVVDLKDRAGSLVRTYSAGMRRRLEIARALIHGPKILFLDEPTLGLDPKAREWVWEHLLGLNKNEGTTIVLSTNYMEEAERLCGRVGIVDRGKMIAVGTPGELKSELAGDVITVKTKRPEEVAQKFKNADFVKETKKVSGKIFFIVENGESAIPRVVELAGGDMVESIELHRPTLSDVFLHYTGREINGSEGTKGGRRKMKRRGRGI
ncbi:ATP-binding cassette domain-containing protein [archaeon]|nr:ATP-binding cassette domain-containing protein [archaeon]